MDDATDTGHAKLKEGETVARGPAYVHAKIGKNLPFLTIIYPHESKGTYLITDEKQIIGRGKHAAIVLNDDLASREHCQFWLGQQGVIIKDMVSTNGTIIDSQTIDEAVLSQESRLLIGTHIFKLEYKNEHELEYDKKLLQAATLDALTGIANRKTLMERARSLYGQCAHNERTLALVMVDIDHFKRVNDSLGHPAGDQVIKQVAQVLAENCSSKDICGRYGGEEFMMLLPDKHYSDLENLCQSVRKQIKDTHFTWEGGAIRVTISMGASVGEGAKLPGLEASVEHADRLLYEAKERGRNRLCSGRIGV